METNIILAGVGGQGILSIAYVIDNAALAAGHHFKQAEVHGMAQRGGAVQSHLRFSDRPIHSDLIPRGRADIVLSIEPLEVFRYLHFLGPEGWVVSSTTPYVNIPDYPDPDVLVAELAELPRTVLIDTGRLARAAGNMRAQNMVVVGAASTLLGFEPDAMLTHVTSLFAAKGDTIVAVNRRAFELGRAAGRFFRGLVEAGVPALDAHRLMAKLEPDTLDADRVGAWAVVAHDRLEEILAADGDLRADEVPAIA